VIVVGSRADAGAEVARIAGRGKKIVANTKANFVIQNDAPDVGKLPASPAAAN